MSRTAKDSDVHVLGQGPICRNAMRPLVRGSSCLDACWFPKPMDPSELNFSEPFPPLG